MRAQPVSSLADLERVVSAARSSGLDVRVRTEGVPTHLPVVVDASIGQVTVFEAIGLPGGHPSMRSCGWRRWAGGSYTICRPGRSAGSVDVRALAMGKLAEPEKAKVRALWSKGRSGTTTTSPSTPPHQPGWRWSPIQGINGALV
jgi:hypothetical protein